MLYPTKDLAAEKRKILDSLEAGIPEFIRVVLNHRPKTLRDRTLIQVMNSQQRQPARLTTLFKQWSSIPEQMYSTSPSLVFAVIGQAKRDGHLTPREENRMLTRLLTHWAVNARAGQADATITPVAAAA